MSTPATTSQDNLQSRLPDPNQFFPELAGMAGAMFKATLNGSIPQTTISLVQLRAGQIVGSTYHTVRQTGHLRQAGETEERITAVASWRDVPYFTDAERVAPELVEAVLTPIRSGSACETELLGAGAERARQEGHGAGAGTNAFVGLLAHRGPLGALSGDPVAVKGHFAAAAQEPVNAFVGFSDVGWDGPDAVQGVPEPGRQRPEDA